MNNRLLPLGSVVNLIEYPNQKKIMIISRLVKLKEEDDVKDYCGCEIPKGFETAEKLIFFDQKDINGLLFIGLQDNEELAYSLGIEEYKKNNGRK